MLVKILKASIIIALAALFALSLASCGKVECESNVYDYADLLSSIDEQRIQKIAENVSETSFFVATHNSTSFLNILTGDELLSRWGYSMSDNIVILVITFDKGAYYYDLYTYGMAERRISGEDADSMLDAPDVKSNIKSGRLAAGVEAFAKETERAMAAPWVLIVVISIAAGLFVATLACVSVRAKYRMRRRPTNYPLDKYAKMELTDSSDEFITSRVSVRVVSSSGSGGRSSGGRGGGGGHRGGR